MALEKTQAKQGILCYRIARQIALNGAPNMLFENKKRAKVRRYLSTFHVLWYLGEEADISVALGKVVSHLIIKGIRHPSPLASHATASCSIEVWRTETRGSSECHEVKQCTATYATHRIEIDGPK